MVFGLIAGVLFALDTVILGIVMDLPVYGSSETMVFLAPYISNFLHYIFSALLLWVWMGLKKQASGAFRALKSRGGQILAVSAVLGGPIGMSSYVVAIHYIGPAYTAAVSALFPAVGALLAHIFLKENLGKLQIAGLLVSVISVCVLGFSPTPNTMLNAPLGFVFAVLCCLSWAMEAVIFSYGFKQSGLTQAQALLIRQCLSAIVCGAIILPLLRGWKSTVAVFPSSSTLLIGLGAALITFSYLFYYIAIEKLGPTKAMSLNITYTAWAIVFSVLLIHMQPDWKSIICSLLIVAGSLTASTRTLPKKKWRSPRGGFEE